MSRKPRVDRSPEEKWQIVQEGLKSGNVCGRAGVTVLLRICTIAVSVRSVTCGRSVSS